MTEHEIQNQIREFLSLYHKPFFRVNVLGGFSGNYRRNLDGSVTIYRPQWITSGVPKGFPDLIGIKPVLITPQMIGNTIGQFAFIEVKTDKGRLTKEQKAFHQLLHDNGAVGGVARSVDDVSEFLK